MRPRHEVASEWKWRVLWWRARARGRRHARRIRRGRADRWVSVRDAFTRGASVAAVAADMGITDEEVAAGYASWALAQCGARLVDQAGYEAMLDLLGRAWDVA